MLATVRSSRTFFAARNNINSPLEAHPLPGVPTIQGRGSRDLTLHLSWTHSIHDLAATKSNIYTEFISRVPFLPLFRFLSLSRETSKNAIWRRYGSSVLVRNSTLGRTGIFFFFFLQAGGSLVNVASRVKTRGARFLTERFKTSELWATPLIKTSKQWGHAREVSQGAAFRVVSE